MKAADGIRELDAAISRGRGAAAAAADRFHGTAPPPPWPSPPLYAAIEQAEDAKDKLESLQRLFGQRDFDPAQPKVAEIIAQIRARVRAVDDEALALTKRADALPSVPMVVEKVKRLARFSVSPALLLLGALVVLDGDW